MNHPAIMIRALVLVVALTASASAQPHQLVENFSALVPGSPGLRAELNTGDPKVGLASLRLHYSFDPPNRAVGIDFGDDRRQLAGGGTAKVWVKGDKSGNDLEIGFREGAVKTEADGRRVFMARRDFSPPRVTLDFEGWKEVDFQVPAAAEGNSLWFQRIVVHPVGKEPKPGTIELDDLRLYQALLDFTEASPNRMPMREEVMLRRKAEFATGIARALYAVGGLGALAALAAWIGGLSGPRPT